MRHVIIKWFTLDGQNYIPEVWIAAGILWLALVVFGLMSVRSQELGRRAKLAWILAIVLLPLVGLFAYCCFCLARVDYYMLDFWFLQKRGKSRR